MWSRNLKNGAALTRIGLFRQREREFLTLYNFIITHHSGLEKQALNSYMFMPTAQARGQAMLVHMATGN
jgi:hypothetical protein